MLLLWIVAGFSFFSSPVYCFVVVPNTCSGAQNRQPHSLPINVIGSQTGTVVLFGGLGAGKWARKLGKLVGGATHDSEWKQVPEAFLEGFEESEINARARNAKQMEEYPAQENLELPSAMDASIIKDAEIISDDKDRSEEEQEGQQSRKL